jgi:hypothetical protein
VAQVGVTPMHRRKSLWVKTPDPPPRCLVIPSAGATGHGVHPMSETAKLRTGLPAPLCWHCLQASRFFQNGAQKLLAVFHGALFAQSSIPRGGAETAGIAETPIWTAPRE